MTRTEFHFFSYEFKIILSLNSTSAGIDVEDEDELLLLKNSLKIEVVLGQMIFDIGLDTSSTELSRLFTMDIIAMFILIAINM